MDSEPLPLNNKSPLSMLCTFVAKTVLHVAMKGLGIKKCFLKHYISNLQIVTNISLTAGRIRIFNKPEQKGEKTPIPDISDYTRY